MDALAAKIRLLFEAIGEQTKDYDDTQDPLSLSKVVTLTTGTGANQANESFHDKRSLAASANEDLDLSGTGLQNAFGTDVALARVKALYIENHDTVTTLTIGAAASNAWATMFADSSDALVLRPGGFMLVAAPGATAYAVTAGTGDLLRVARGAGSPTDTNYTLAVLGALS